MNCLCFILFVVFNLKSTVQKVNEEPTIRLIRNVEEDPNKSTDNSVALNCPTVGNQSQVDAHILSIFKKMLEIPPIHGVNGSGLTIFNPLRETHSKRINVFIVPYSHNDPGWLSTFETYYTKRTQKILNNTVNILPHKPNMKFIWAEMVFLERWWREASTQQRQTFKRLLRANRIEIVTGGWVMNDEALSHWVSIAQQLTTGHQWLLDVLEYIPVNAWSTDPFGHSSSQAYLLKLAGFKNSIIRRVHYRVKIALGFRRRLQFRWRQVWDGTGQTDMFTHVMADGFDSFHGGTLDENIFLQEYDFHKVDKSDRINNRNIHNKSLAIVNHWRRGSMSYRTDALLYTIGGSFRFWKPDDWEDQFTNYKKIMDYIQSQRREWKAEVKFGTINDYFNAVYDSSNTSKFPVISGEFMPYADDFRDYWTGFYSLRSFYKYMDRVLLAYVRAAEIITTQAMLMQNLPGSAFSKLHKALQNATQTLSLFQHHDAITGTSKTAVMEDYATKNLNAIKNCQFAIQNAAYYVLGKPEALFEYCEDKFFEVDDVWKKPTELPTRNLIVLNETFPQRGIMLYNPLPFTRTEILTVTVANPNVEVIDPEGNLVMAQLSPEVAKTSDLEFTGNFELSFPVSVGALALISYMITLRKNPENKKFITRARVRTNRVIKGMPRMWSMNPEDVPMDLEFVLRAGTSQVVCHRNGLLKAVILENSILPVEMSYVKYDTTLNGAYLFNAKDTGSNVNVQMPPHIAIVEGLYKSTVYSAIVKIPVNFTLEVTVINNPTMPHAEVQVVNTGVGYLMTGTDYNIAMRFSTGIQNGDVFYTDVNGLQMIQRQYLEKAYIQGNYYPMSSAAYIEDEIGRFTLLTETPVGMAAMAPGQLEVMLERMIKSDDRRGLDEQIIDSHLAQFRFKIVVETNQCQQPSKESLHGALSLGAHVASSMLQQPLVALQHTFAWLAPRAAYTPPLTNAADLVIASFRSHVASKANNNFIEYGMGMTFHRVHLDSCYANMDLADWYPIGDGQVQISEYVDVSPEYIYESTLTYNRILSPVPNGVLNLCPNEIRSVFINITI